jgi:peptidoglycan/LPS O-acetylase OafA/YrhL
VRPLTAPFAAVFGLLVAAEDLYLAWLLWEPDPGWDWFVLAPAGLALLAAAGAVLVLRGRGRGWLVLTLAAVPSVLLLLAVALLFGVLGDGGSVGWALLLLTGPVGCLVLAVRRPVREWTRPRRGTPAPVPAGPGRPRARGR